MAEKPAKTHATFRRAGINNVIISCVVAVLSYFSLTLIAARYGSSIGSDAYLFLFSLTTIASGLLSSLFGVVLVPIFVEIKIKTGIQEAGEFAGSILSLCLLILIPLTFSSYIWHTQFFSLTSKFSSHKLALTQHILIYFAPIFCVTVLAEYFRMLALALGKYTQAALSATFQPAMLIIFIYSYADQIAEEAMSLSLLLGRLAVLVFMMFVVLGQERLKMPIKARKNSNISRFASISAPYWSANMVSNFATFYFDYMATGLGTGILTSIAYAQRVFLLPLLVVINPILEISRVRFAELRASGDLISFARQHNKLMQFILYFTIPVSAALIFFAHEIISSLFERGAFSKENVGGAASCLQIFALTIPVNSLFMLNGRAVESFQRLIWPSIFGTAGQFISIFVTYMLANQLGYFGIPT